MQNSKKQEQVLACGINEDVLINAGAGSGKTTVLKNKIAQHLLKDELQPADLLVLTFTNNSAHDMKTQIIDAVNELKPENEQDKQRLEKLKNAINSAHIQTFDSYAQEIVKEFADHLNIPNTIFIANEFVLEAYKIDTLNKIFEEKYKANDKNFLNFLARYNNRDDSKTKQVILGFYEQLSKYTDEKRKTIIAQILGYNNKEQFTRWVSEYRSLLTQKDNDRIAGLEEKNRAKNIANQEERINLLIGDENKEFQRYSSTFVDIKIILDICDELRIRLKKYKEETHTYTYHDIANMSLILLKDEKIASIVRNRFKYIMIDEYQDTNRLQKEVIDILTMPKDNCQERNHLFCVGDPKQSIYGFRDADVNIFRETQSDFNLTGKVISMDENFRSFGNIIDDANKIFNSYMTFSHGGIVYNEPGQSLVLPDVHKDFYNDNFGLHVLTTDNEKDLLSSSASEIKLWEAQAIAQDIKSKLDPKNPFMVWDKNETKNNGYRPCKPKDIFILVRTKSNYALFERVFAQAGIDLNNEVSANLVEVNSIMLINSLVKALAIIEKNDNSIVSKEQLKHIFASIARSYIYRHKYTDQEILDKIKDNSYLTDQIFIDLKTFYNENEHLSFSKMFSNLIDKFEINSKLFEIGEVEKNIAKIESLYQLILAIEQAGGRIQTFSELLDIISKHSIELENKSITDLDNAVTLMTIHQAKGLQNKIIYLPNSVNHLGGQSSIDKPDYDFSEEFGLLLPIYNFDDYRNIEVDVDGEATYPNGSEIYSLPYKLYRESKKVKAKDIDEHVRLFYVALTRAEQVAYIVGYPKCTTDEANNYIITGQNKETLFHMLGYVNGAKIFPYGNKNAFPIGKWHYVSIQKEKKLKPKEFEIKNTNDNVLTYPVRHKARASQLNIKDKEVDEQVINKGNVLHQIMENIDLDDPSFDFIHNKEYKEIITKVLAMPLFCKDLRGATFFQEYEYFDKQLLTNGSIDLLAIKDGIYYIIDYKLFDTSKKEYEKQMHIYQRNIQEIFNIDKSKIKLILVSLEKASKQTVDPE